MPEADDSQRFDAVGGTRFSDVEWYAEIGSTNTELLERARSGAPEGLVMIADLQTAGRGRRGRRWTAPPGTSLMMSVLLRPPHAALPTSRASLVTLALGLAAADACDETSGVRPRLKWPNDLVVSRADEPGQPDRKVAGILAESITGGGRLEALVIGMGLNTGWPQVPPELAAIATSLNVESGAPVDRTLLARRVLEGFERRYVRLCGGDGGDGAALLDEARRCSATLGRRVRIEFDAAALRTPNGRDAAGRADANALEGVATDLDADGRLLVTDLHGVVHTVAVGDVVHLRAATGDAVK
ncbi:biotin--[acetyl-CoA-carboxylase] ligase [Candidatus Poriferisodalis sp.]|uniref:biotin--[acetyl-CoA-carboxylase] ligase n=1 Tax=Candidatus Poriferisodalis sp. TaxID=3101277 RepID=UPI003D0DBE8D